MLILAASVGKAASDTLLFNYRGSIFAHWAQQRTRWGYWWAWWSGPDSLTNKDLAGGPPWWRYLLRTALVATQDAWHAAQSLHLNGYRLAVGVALAHMLGHPLWSALGWAALFAGLHGLIFESFYNFILRHEEPDSKDDGPARRAPG